MKGYAVQVFGELPRTMMALAETVVEKLPDEDGLRCHEVARVVYGVLVAKYPTETGLELIDGRYRFVDHSWLLVPGDTRHRRFILDPYAVGRLPMVQLVDSICGLGAFYEPGADRIDIRTEWVQTYTVEIARGLQIV